MFKKKVGAAGTALTISALVLASLGGGIASAGTKAHATDPVKAKALAMVKGFMTVPTINQWPIANTAFHPGHFKGVAIGCGFTAQACEQPTVWAAQAMKAMGWNVGPAEDGQNSTTVESNLVEKAVQQKDRGIIFTGVDVNTIPTAVNDAVNAGIKIMCVVCISGAKWKGKVIDVTPNWYQAGVIAAWETLSISGSKTWTAQFYDPEFAAIRFRDAGVEATFKAACPKCKLDTIPINGPDVGLPGPPPWTAYLATHPAGTVNNVIAEYDGGAIVTSLTDVSAGRKLPIGSYDGEIPNLQGISTGKPAPITWSVGQPYDFEPWAAADALGRWVNHVAIPKNLNQMPLVLVTKANVKEFLAGNPKGSDYIAPLDNWQLNFRALWLK